MPAVTTPATLILRTVGASLHLTSPRDERLDRADIPGLTYDQAQGRYALPATTRTIHALEAALGPIADTSEGGLTGDHLTLSLVRAARLHPDHPSQQATPESPRDGNPAAPAPTPTPTRTPGETGELEPRSCIARVEGTRLLIDSPFEAKDKLQAIPEGRWNKKAKAWTYPATIQHLRLLKRVLKDALALHPTARALVEQAKEAQEVERVASLVKDTGGQELPHVRTQGWRHQKQAFAFASSLRRALLNMHMGTGKTLVSLALVAHHTQSAAVVLAPKRVVRVWPQEVEKHLEDPSEWLVLPLSEGSTKKRAAAITEGLQQAQREGRRLLVALNYEAAHRDPLASTLLGLEADVVILDEIHRIKSPQGKASKFAAKLAARAEYRYGLTGTLIPNGPEDVWAQYRALEPNLLGSWSTFVRDHLVHNQFGGIAGYRDLQKLHDKINRRTYRATKDVIELPPVQHQTIDVDLKPKTRRLAREIYEELTAEFEAGSITTTTFLTKLLRVQQLTGGTAVLDDGTHEFIDNSKEQALEDLLTDLPKDEPVVVFANFHDDLDAIQRVTERLGRRYAELSGRRDELESWQEGNADVIGIQIHAGGLGISCVRACMCVYYSNSYNLGSYSQSTERVHRPGQEKPVRFYHLIAKDSVDEDIHNALTSKKNLAEFVIDRARGAAAPP